MHTHTRLLPLTLCLLIACGDDPAPQRPLPDPDADLPPAADMAADLAADMAAPRPDAPPDAWVPDGGALIPTPTAGLRLSPDRVTIAAGASVQITASVEGAGSADALAVEGAPAGLAASWRGDTLTLEPAAALEGTFTLAISARIDGQRRTAPLLLTITRAPARGLIVGGVLMDGQRRPIVNQPVTIPNLVDPGQVVMTDQQGRFTATVAALPWSLAFTTDADGQDVVVAALDIATTKASVTAPRQIDPPELTEERALTIDPSPLHPTRPNLIWLAPPASDAQPGLIGRGAQMVQATARWHERDARALSAMIIEQEQPAGSQLALPRRMAFAQDTLPRAGQATVALGRMIDVDHQLLYISAPPITTGFIKSAPDIQVGLCVDDFTRLQLPAQRQGDDATIAIPRHPDAPLTPCATIIRRDGTRTQTSVLGKVAAGVTYTPPALTSAQSYPAPSAGERLISWQSLRGVTYVLVGAEAEDAPGFAVITQRTSVTHEELEALGINPHGTGERALTLHVIHDAPMSELLSADDLRLSWSHYAAQRFTSHRISY
jgi:hypothetical protein